MPLVIRDGANTPRTITEIQMRDGANTPRDLVELWVRDSNNVPRLIWSIAPPMSATATPAPVFGSTLGTGVATTDPTTATPTGGTPPYSYAWQLVSYDAGVPPTADSSNSATTTFTQTGIVVGDGLSATFRCLVTDSTPGTPLSAYTNNVGAFWIDVT